MSKLKIGSDKLEKALQLKITLLDLSPEVWRRVAVPMYFTLQELHGVMQEVMPWTDSHMHQFKKKDEIYSSSEFDFIDEGVQDESQITLTEIFPKVKSKIEYEYDFGDGWRHEVQFEKVLNLDATQSLMCLEGKNACPPDDSGGVWGYVEMLEVIKNPNHPEHEDMREWLGEKFDPKLFDIKKANSRLKKRFKLKTIGGWAKQGAELRP